jgi:hypothetical protein
MVRPQDVEEMAHARVTGAVCPSLERRLASGAPRPLRCRAVCIARHPLLPLAPQVRSRRARIHLVTRATAVFKGRGWVGRSGRAVRRGVGR